MAQAMVSLTQGNMETRDSQAMGTALPSSKAQGDWSGAKASIERNSDSDCVYCKMWLRPGRTRDKGMQNADRYFAPD